MNNLEPIKNYIQTVAYPVEQELKYLNLNQFKDMLTDVEKQRQPYSLRKEIVWVYRLIFSLVGLMLIGLGYLAYSSNPHPLLSQFIFVQFKMLKLLIPAFSIMLGVISLLFAAALKAEKEACKYAFHHARKELKRTYRNRLARLNFFSKFIPFGSVYQQYFILKDAYHKASHLIEHERQITLSLLKKIAHTNLVNAKAKETLFNEALLEFESSLKAVIDRFST